MTDKDKIRAEVEKWKLVAERGIEGEDDPRRFLLGKVHAFDQILSFIDKLPEESASEDLEEAADNALRSNIIPDLPAPAFRLGYSLGWEQSRNQLMKNAVDGVCSLEFEDGTGAVRTASEADFKLNGLHCGDQVKLIIIKED